MTPFMKKLRKEGWLYAALVPVLFAALGCATTSTQSRRQSAVRQMRAIDTASQVGHVKPPEEKPVRSAPTEPPASP